jgi:hypothetical protein
MNKKHQKLKLKLSCDSVEGLVPVNTMQAFNRITAEL